MRNRGAAVMGVLGADANEFGTTGICPDAIISAVSVFGLRGGAAEAVRIAADALTRGDIILIELHQPGPRHGFVMRGDDQDGYVPVEFFPDTFAAIRYATARGVIVVEAAGNGGQQLDDSLYDEVPAGFPPTWTNPFNPKGSSYVDSGAVLVGAGAPPGGGEPASSRMKFSNWGERLDAHGWGDRVATTGGFFTGGGDLAGGPDETRWYTSKFSGTSSAAPMVAGALACVQGVLRARAIRRSDLSRRAARCGRPAPSRRPPQGCPRASASAAGRTSAPSSSGRSVKPQDPKPRHGGEGACEYRSRSMTAGTTTALLSVRSRTASHRPSWASGIRSGVVRSSC